MRRLLSLRRRRVLERSPDVFLGYGLLARLRSRGAL
jgi:hypothetical protein